jgi:hypothetical protein
MTSAVPGPIPPSRIRLRRAFTAEWEQKNPILADGEPGYERGANKLKVGDGVTPWNQLGYLTPPTIPVVKTSTVAASDGTIDAVMVAHVQSETPHPVYDDGPSLLLLYKNAKV